MIEIIADSLEEQIIRVLQKKYPITIADLVKNLHASQARIERVLQKFQVNGIVRLQPLPDKTYIRLLRSDFCFVGKKHQQRIMKHESQKKKSSAQEYDGIMYT